MAGNSYPGRRLTRREFLKLTAVTGAGAGAAWALGACAPAATPAPTEAKKLAETAHVIHGTYNPNWANNVLFELAEEKGWFQEEGITSKETVIVDQDQIFPALIGGSLMTAQQDTDAVAKAHNAGEPIWFVAVYRDKEPWMFAVGPEIKTLEDLKGKQVSGGRPGTRNEYNGKEMLRRLGLDPEKDVEWVPVSGGSDSRVQAVIEGVIAGTVMFPRHGPMIKEAGGQVIYEGLEDVPQDCLCVHQSWMEKNERTIVGFLKATFKSRQYFQDLGHKDELIAIMEKRGYEFSDTFRQLYEADQKIVGATGAFDVAAMEKLIADAVKTGGLETAVDWRTFVKLDYLNQAFRELGREDLVISV